MKVGDYVRTKDGIIAKINNIIEDLSIDCDIDVYYECNLKDKMPMMEIPYNLKNEYIIKSSPNIIDLIEVGDVIRYKDEYGNVLIRDVHNSAVMYDIKFKNIEVLSIVTKEQFESMEYKVGD